MTPNIQYRKILNILEVQLRELNNVKKSLTQLEEVFQNKLSEVEQKRKKQLEDNTQCITKVNAFVGIARAHTNCLRESVNAIEFDNGKLARLAVQINNVSHNDIYAEKLYTEATGQLIYLKGRVFQINQDCNEEIASLKIKYSNQRNLLQNKYREIMSNAQTFCFSQDFTYLVELLKKDDYLFQSGVGSIIKENAGYISIGVVKEALPIIEECNNVISKSLGNLYDSITNKVGLPYSVENNSNTVFSIGYLNETEGILLKGIQNFILNILKYCPEKYEQVCLFDPIRYNNSSLGCLGAIADNENGIIDCVPLSQDAIRKKINSIIGNINAQESGFTSFANKKKLLIFHNFPQAYDSAVIAQIQQLCVNAERYNLTIMVTHNNSSKNMLSSDSLNYIQSIAKKIECIQSKFFVVDSNTNKEFQWYQAPEKLPACIQKRYVENKPVVDKSNNYKKRVGLDKTVVITKGVRKIENIPFGVDLQGNLKYIDFENSNFATFICGASRSGKSTLLHTILTGIMQKTHPDDVEIWLIDFKMTEFSRYIEHLPPHIRYILLDESPELVYDIIDRLTEIMIKRQNIFKGKWQKLDEVPKDKYMPALFVVIDEFSVMSQIVADSISGGENYVVKMQALLAKGAALGMHFIFASQGFTSGTRGLNDFSKKQIQQRIAMKTEFNEIKETLDLKSASDGDRAMMEQLPVHHALVRIPIDIQGNHLSLVKALYIENYSEQENMIDQMCREYAVEKKYDVNNHKAYIYKKPMIIDGNRYSAFYEHMDEVKEKIRELDLYDEIVLFTGEPRRMIPQYPILFNKGFCENLLMVASSIEIEPAASVVLSSMESLKLQNIDYEIWGTNRNSFYKCIKHMRSAATNVSLELNQVCERIKKIKQEIQNKKEVNKVLFLFGLETLMLDMSFQPKDAGVKEPNSKTASMNIEKRAEGEMDLNMLLASLTATGKTNTDTYKAENKIERNVEVEDVKQTAIYDAREDLKYIFTHGPRQGYHFFVAYNTAGEMMQCKIDVTLFKHKILFRMAKSDAMSIIGSSGSNVISELSDHSYRYSNGLEAVSFRPYLHKNLSWDGWKVENGLANNVVDEEEEYLL